MINTGITSVIDGSGNMTAGIGVLASRYAFWAGGTLDDAANGTAAFVVGHNGVLKATGANIQGHIVATSGSFTGSIYASGGTIGSWTLDSYKMYRPSVWSNPHVYGTGVAATSTHGDPAFWAGFLGNLGNPWSHNANQDSSGNIIDGPWQNYTNFYVTNAGYLCAKNAYIKGHIEANSGTFKGTVSAGTIISNGCYIGSSVKVDESSNVIKLMHKTSTGSYVGIYSTWVELACSRTSVYVTNSKGTLAGTWETNSGTAVTSDANKKHQIETMPEQYEVFYDNLNPIRYKYNDGTSDRYHTGFISQEVKSALDSAGIDTKDFAGLVIFDEGTEKELWTLRYNEFVSLNTWEIQKLKRKIKKLELQIKQLQ